MDEKEFQIIIDAIDMVDPINSPDKKEFVELMTSMYEEKLMKGMQDVPRTTN